MVSKKLFLLILGVSAGLVVGISLFVVEPRFEDRGVQDIAREAKVYETYEKEVNVLVHEHLFGHQGAYTKQLLTSVRERLLSLRAPKELRDFHLKLVTTLDAMLYKPEEALASPSELDDILRGETWVKAGN